VDPVGEGHPDGERFTGAATVGGPWPGTAGAGAGAECRPGNRPERKSKPQASQN
jgi:hypothetical protein